MNLIKRVYRERKLKKFLRGLSFDSLVLVWQMTMMFCYTVQNSEELNGEELFNAADIIQNEIYCRDDSLKKFVEAVESLGIDDIIVPYCVLREFLIYAMDESGEGDEGIFRRVEHGNLANYIRLKIIPMMEPEMAEKITNNDIDKLVDQLAAHV